ncbi:hypothetical protein [Pelomonas cellulosilytica]|uniref:Uncharacterized protein n=1 Tax=Pelomonas cellulosilytica TaxID=2906762 RepID=A0ABS8XS75_9BURK|nr:hypothetical protein [Pelomonas sp. P8]MCE4554585.1 hypothetical protein [Pelomonas sp. P8]
MTVTLAGKPLQQVASLSPEGRLSLAFVDGGPEWLAWAAQDVASRYDFADETTLLGQVQLGLHASRLALLPNLELMVSPVKLMTLGLTDLRTLARAETGDGSAATVAQVAGILSAHQLAARRDLAAGAAWLSELGLADAPIFQAPDLDDRLALWQLACMAPPTSDAAPALRQEAANFAAIQARTPLEFCDYFRTYLARTAGLASASPQQRADAAAATLRVLLPLLFGTLDCPQLDGLPSPAQVEATISNWLARGKQVGFARLSQAVQQIVQHTHLQDDSVDAARKAIQLYLQSAQAFLSSNRPTQGRLGQDGATCTYTYGGGSLGAEVQVGPGGVVSLQDFGPRPQPGVLNEENAG